MVALCGAERVNYVTWLTKNVLVSKNDDQHTYVHLAGSCLHALGFLPSVFQLNDATLSVKRWELHTAQRLWQAALLGRHDSVNP